MKHMYDVIYLVGFMGAGKSCVGRRLAEILRYGFIDLDDRIEERAGRTIRDIFAREGEPFFRDLETQQLEKVSSLTGQVVALGGGSFCLERNRIIVQATGVSIWLDAPAAVLYSRCAGQDSRPLLGEPNEMEALLESRRCFYEKADLRIDVGNRTVDDAAREIAQILTGSGSDGVAELSR